MVRRWVPAGAGCWSGVGDGPEEQRLVVRGQQLTVLVAVLPPGLGDDEGGLGFERHELPADVEDGVRRGRCGEAVRVATPQQPARHGERQPPGVAQVAVPVRAPAGVLARLADERRRRHDTGPAVGASEPVIDPQRVGVTDRQGEVADRRPPEGLGCHEVRRLAHAGPHLGGEQVHAGSSPVATTAVASTSISQSGRRRAAHTTPVDAGNGRPSRRSRTWPTWRYRCRRPGRRTRRS